MIFLINKNRDHEKRSHPNELNYFAQKRNQSLMGNYKPPIQPQYISSKLQKQNLSAELGNIKLRENISPPRGLSKLQYREIKNVLVENGLEKPGIPQSRNSGTENYYSSSLSPEKRLDTKQFLQKKYQDLVRERLGENSQFIEYKRNLMKFYGEKPNTRYFVFQYYFFRHLLASCIQEISELPKINSRRLNHSHTISTIIIFINF